MKKVLVTGSDGMVGSRFVELNQDKFDFLLPSEKELDITEKKSVEDFISKQNPSVIVNFAAYTNVNEAEKQRGDKDSLCWQVNVEGVKNLVDSIDQSKTHFIQISTDMVFSGSTETQGPYSEETPPEQDLKDLTWYGYTKAEADRYVIEKLGDKYSIVRITYPVRAKFKDKQDYLRRPLGLYDKNKLYPLIDNQQVSISFIDEIAAVLEKIIKKNMNAV